MEDICKTCGRRVELECCYNCQFEAIQKWMFNDTGKDVYLRLERKLDDLKTELEKIKEAINKVIPKTKKLNITDWDNLI